MRRRRVMMSFGGLALTGGLAGCTEEETTTTSSNDDGGNEDGEGGGNSNDGGGLVFEEDELVADTYTTQIEGVLLNNTGEEQSYVEVRSSVYNDEDVRIDDFLDNTTDLADGERWQFEILVTADADDIARYELEASTGF